MKREAVRKLRLAYWNGLEMPAACAYAGIAESEYTEACERDPRFREAMRSAQAYPAFAARRTWQEAIERGNANAAIKFLERRQPERYDLQYIRKFGRSAD